MRISHLHRLIESYAMHHYGVAADEENAVARNEVLVKMCREMFDSAFGMGHTCSKYPDGETNIYERDIKHAWRRAFGREAMKWYDENAAKD